MMSEEMMTAWYIYLGATLALLILLWLALYKRLGRSVTGLFILCVAVFFFVPSPIEPGSDFWAPAFMVALMAGIDQGLDVALQRLSPLFTVMLICVVISAFRRSIFWWWKKRRGASPEAP